MVAQVGLNGLVLIRRTRVVPGEAAGRNEAVDVCPDFFEAREELGSTNGEEVWAAARIRQSAEMKSITMIQRWLPCRCKGSSTHFAGYCETAR